jgi:predicted SprT family Zn-dependent metalloprotease
MPSVDERTDRDRTAVTRTLLYCECGTPYVGERTKDDRTVPVGVSRCTDCGGETFVRATASDYEPE